MRGHQPHSHKALALASCAGLTLIGSAAWGQTAPPGAPGGEVEVGELIVTALRRDTKLQDAPAAISALGEASLSRLGAKTFNDYYRTVPSLQITENAGSPGQSRISLRGIWAAGDPTVGLYYGESSIVGPTGNTSDAGLATPNLNLFDVQRVEVLRGPQGTLYGSGSVGGTIRVIFNEPNLNDFEGKVEAQASAVEHGGAGYYARAGVSIPIVQDKLALRAVAYTEQVPGYIDNIRYGYEDVNEGEIHGGRLILKYAPREDIDLTLTGLYQETHFDDNSSWYQAFGAKSYRTDQSLQTPFDDEFTLLSAVLNWQTPIGKLTSASTYYSWTFQRAVDPTATLNAFTVLGATAPVCGPFTGVAVCTPAQQASFRAAMLGMLPTSFSADLGLYSRSQEVRLTSPGGGFLDWTLGVYYEDRHDKITSLTAQGSATTGQIFDPFVVNGATFTRTDQKQFSQFAEISIHPTQQLTLTAGTRHYHYDKDVQGQVLQTTFISGSFAGPLVIREARNSGWVSKVNLAYKFTPDVLAYAQWAEGFRPGGANNVPGLSNVLAVYQPDSLESYEIGLKTSWDGGRYTFNIAAFQIDWADIQSTLTVFPAFRVVTNAGEARIRGLEIEGSARPLEGLRLSGAFSYIPKADLTAAQAGASIVNSAQNGIVGDRLPYTAKVTASVSADYTWPVGGDLEGIVHVNANYHGGSANEFRPTYTFYERLPNFTEVNLRVGVQAPDWSMSLFLNNATAAVGALATISSFAIPPFQWERQLASLRPRTAGVTISRNF